MFFITVIRTNIKLNKNLKNINLIKSVIIFSLIACIILLGIQKFHDFSNILRVVEVIETLKMKIKKTVVYINT